MAVRETRVGQSNEISQEKRQELLRGVPLLHGFASKSFANLAALMGEEHIGYGFGISQPLDPQYEMYIISEGEATVHDKDGKRKVGQGSVLNEGALLDPTKPCRVLSISLGANLLTLSGTDFARFLEAYPAERTTFDRNQSKQASPASS